MPQGGNLSSCDVDVAHVEELDVRVGAAIQLLDKRLSLRPLNLKTVVNARDWLPHGPRGSPVVVCSCHLVSACLGVELNPIGGRRAPDVKILILLQVKENPVANDI